MREGKKGELEGVYSRYNWVNIQIGGRMKTKNFLWITTLLVTALVLSACGAKNQEPTPTPVDVNAIAVNAIQTFSMQLTMTAFAQPTATSTPVPPTNTNPPATFIIVGTGSPAAAPTSSCDVSAYVQDVTVPDGTVMAPGQVFVKKWEVKNTGTCTWSPTYKLGFGYGNPMGGIPAAIGKTVAPGASITLEITLTAPSSAGDVSGVWRLQNDKGQFFGTNVTVVIKVAGTPAKTSTPSETPEATVTSP